MDFLRLHKRLHGMLSVLVMITVVWIVSSLVTGTIVRLAQNVSALSLQKDRYDDISRRYAVLTERNQTNHTASLRAGLYETQDDAVEALSSYSDHVAKAANMAGLVASPAGTIDEEPIDQRLAAHKTSLMLTGTAESCLTFLATIAQENIHFERLSLQSMDNGQCTVALTLIAFSSALSSDDGEVS